MKYIDIKLSLPLVAPLVEIIKQAAFSLRSSLAVPLAIDDLDPDFREVWTDELLQNQNSELQHLLGLFDKRFYQDGNVRVTAAQADAIIRSSAALRLEIRRSALSKIPDSVLESGSIDVDQLQDPLRTCFLSYIFLANIQEIVIKSFHGEGAQEPGSED